MYRGDPFDGAFIKTEANVSTFIRTGVDALSFAKSPDGASLAANTWNHIILIASSGPALPLTQSVGWVETLTWTKMDANGVLTRLYRETWETRRVQLEKLGGTKIQ